MENSNINHDLIKIKKSDLNKKIRFFDFLKNRDANPVH